MVGQAPDWCQVPHVALVWHLAPKHNANYFYILSPEMLLYMTCNGRTASDVVFAIFEPYWWDHCAFALVSSYNIHCYDTLCLPGEAGASGLMNLSILLVFSSGLVLNQHRYLTSWICLFFFPVRRYSEILRFQMWQCSHWCMSVAEMLLRHASVTELSVSGPSI